MSKPVEEIRQIQRDAVAALEASIDEQNAKQAALALASYGASIAALDCKILEAARNGQGRVEIYDPEWTVDAVDLLSCYYGRLGYDVVTFKNSSKEYGLGLNWKGK